MTPEELHRSCCVADAHADSLMWNRDLTVASEDGHVDFVRLREGGVKLQCFTLVTRGFPFIGGFPVFAWKQGWPSEATKGEWARAQFQIDALEKACARSNDSARITGTRSALEDNLTDERLSAVLGVEGGHALEGDASRVRRLFERNVRFMSLTHLGNNALGGSSFPFLPKKGLSAHGRDVLDEMAAVGMSVDVAHASARTLEDILSHPTARPMCSHTGVRGAGGGWRNLPDDALRRIADKGGVIGIIFGTVYLGGDRFEDVARHIEHAWNVMGEDAVALGSDFDGMVPLPRGMRDVRDLPSLTRVLLERGHPPQRIQKVLGESWRRFFGETFPP